MSTIRYYGIGHCPICNTDFVKSAPRQFTCTNQECKKTYRRKAEAVYRHKRFPDMGTRKRRYSGEEYENTPEKLSAIFAKYENGVTKEHIEKWINGM